MSPISLQHRYQDLVSDALEARDSTIPPAYRLPKSAYPLPSDVSCLSGSSGILDSSESEITNLTASQLRDAIAKGVYTATQVTTAYIKAAAIAQQGSNCLVELFSCEALERARLLDEAFNSTGSVVGPLHGVPVSIKDHIDVKGHDSPSGFLALVGKMTAADDAHLVSVLREAGAIFYTKTTNPQSIMHLETASYLGVTVCPYNTKLSAGGSSGGEAALMAMKGSCLGVGSDIGGSIRSPAAACGVYGFKPSVGRLPYGGCNVPICPPGSEGILGSQGPFGRSVEDLELYMQVMLRSKPWFRDPKVHVKPWRDVPVLARPLRVGILRHDGVVAPVSSIYRALEFVTSKLSASADFELVEYNPIMGGQAWDIISQLYWPDGGEMVLEHIEASGEPILPLTQWAIGKSKRRMLQTNELFELVRRRDDFRRKVASHWQSSDIDVLLSPVGPTPAPKLGTAKYWNYTSFWNLANYPSAVFPTGLFVDPDIDSDEMYCATSDDERWIQNTFSAELSAGAPLALQLIGYCGHEEETLAALKTIVALIRK